MAIVFNGVEVADTIKNVEGTTPIGSILEWPTNTPPQGWLICNGQNVSRTEYDELFAVLGTTYGTGNGSTTFALPDHRGRVGVGLNASETEFNALNKKAGEKTHTLSIDEMPEHNHMQSLVGGVIGNAGNDAAYNWTIPENQYNYDGDDLAQARGGSLAHNNLQPYITINYIIKAKNIPTTREGLSISDVYPVGSIYISVNNTNPSTLFGGTWISFGAGRTLVGVDTSQTEFDTVKKTGGEKTHKLTKAEMPEHTHVYGYSVVTFYGTDATGVEAGTPYQTGENGLNYAWEQGGGGKDIPHNNLQPYITVYFWQRTA